MFSAKPYASHPWPQAICWSGSALGSDMQWMTKQDNRRMAKLRSSSVSLPHGEDGGEVAGHDGATANA